MLFEKSYARCMTNVCQLLRTSAIMYSRKLVYRIIRLISVQNCGENTLFFAGSALAIGKTYLLVMIGSPRYSVGL